jgi:hypothetical protein
LGRLASKWVPNYIWKPRNPEEGVDWKDVLRKLDDKVVSYEESSKFV